MESNNFRTWEQILKENEELRRDNASLRKKVALLEKIKAGLVFFIMKLRQKLQVKEIEATHDTLTGLANRRLIMDELTRMFGGLSRQEGAKFSVAIIDVDFFKKINDSYGHLVGDEVLKLLSQTLADFFRRGHELVGRFGGEEFIVLFPGSIEVAEAYLERIRSVIEFAVRLENLPDLCVTVSIGLSSVTFTGERPNVTEEELLDQADRALYLVKVFGRNGVGVYKEVAQLQ